MDTACSSSLAATHLGRKAILTEECNTATVAGTNVMIVPQTTAGICNLQALAIDGRCKTLDATANGYGRAEAIIAVILSKTEKQESSDQTQTSNISVFFSSIIVTVMP